MLLLKKILLPAFTCISLLATAQVKYDEGAVYVDGLTFLQSNTNPMDYYYLPQFPRLATKADGTFQFLCIKYTGERPENNGGLIHALVDFKVPDDLLRKFEDSLQRRVPGAKIRGAVPLLEAKNDDNENIRPGFDIVSGVLSNKEGKEAMTRNVVTSGYAPFTPGSQAAIAAILNPSGATLLWSSFSGPTSDISIAVNGYYEAVVKAYNATVTAEMDVVYKHFSQLSSNQEGFKKEEIRKVTNELIKSGSIKVEEFDRTSGLGIKPGDLQGILSIVTNKLTEIMFNSETGWSKDPQIVDPNLGFHPRGIRGQKAGTVGDITEIIGALGDAAQDAIGAMPVIGWFSSKSKRNTNPMYVTDNQFVLKDVKDIRSNRFYLNLSKSTTIKVPFHTAGNLGGLFARMGNDSLYFRIVNMDDPTYQRRGINFQVDGDFVDAFDDILNFVTVNFRKKYGNGQSDITANLTFNAADMKKGITVKEITYPRLGIMGADWSNYEYQVLWSFKGRSDVVRTPADTRQWIKSADASVSLVPPLVKEYVEIDADRTGMQREGISSANISFASVQSGERKVIRNVIIRQDDKTSTNRITLYHDPGSPVVFQPTWYNSSGEARTDMTVMTSTIVNLILPTPDKFVKQP